MGLPVLTSKEVAAALERAGFSFKSQRGSHAKYVKGGRAAIIPMHDIVAKGTLRSILLQAGMTAEEFLVLLPGGK